MGILGGYTTFSSFEYETYQAVRGGSHWIGIVNVVGSVAAGYLAGLAGYALKSRQRISFDRSSYAYERVGRHLHAR